MSSLNRGMRALGVALRRRGFAYVLGLTVIVLLAGAAGMYRFESESQASQGFSSYGDALWWTAMISVCRIRLRYCVYHRVLCRSR